MKKLLLYISLIALVSCDLFIEEEKKDNPEAPTSIIAEVYFHGIKVSWKKPNKSEKFNIYRKDPNSEWTLISENNTEESFIDGSPLSNTDLFYGVQTVYKDKTTEIISTTAPIKIDLSSIIEKPSEVKAVVSQADVTITWEESSNAKNYQVFIKYGENEWKAVSDLQSESTFIHKDPVIDTEVLYGVKAEFGGIFSSLVEISEMVKFIHTPDVPGNLKVVNTNNKAEITWDTVSNANNYKVYRRDDSSDWVLISGLIAKTTFLDESTNFDSNLYYAVKAEFEGMLSDYSYSNENIRFVSKPTNIKTLITGTDVVITWNGFSSNKYNVYKKVGTGQWSKMNSELLVNTTYVDSSSVFNKDIYYGVEAVYSDSSSELTEMVSGIKLSSSLLTINNLKVHSLQNANSIRLSWNKFNELAKYHIYRSDSEDVMGSEIGNTSNLSFEDTTATPGTIYFYRVTWSIEITSSSGGESITPEKGFCYTIADTKEPNDNDKANITTDNLVLNSRVDSVIYKMGDDRDVDWYRYTVPPRNSHKIVTQIESGSTGIGHVYVYLNGAIYSEKSIPYMDLLLNNNTSEPLIFYIKVTSEVTKTDNFIEKYDIKITQEL